MIQSITINRLPIIEFGIGRINRLINHLQGAGRVFLLVDPASLGAVQSLSEQLRTAGTEVLVSTEVVPEPPLEVLESLLEPVAAFAPDAVVGVGGGSAMDLAKLVSVLYTREQTVSEIMGIDNVHGRKVKLITVTTTSGTGSEVTPIAILTDVANKLKKGVVSPYLIADVAIVDPELTLSVPPAVTAATGMDAMTHCIEAYTNVNAHPIIDTLALEGIRLIGAHIKRAVDQGGDLGARSAMSLGSLYGGMCLGPVNTAAVHALAYPLGGEFKVSHGVANSLLLPYVMQFNAPACADRYARVADALGLSGSSEHSPRLAILKVKELSAACGIPASLQDLDIPEEAIPGMARAAMQVARLLNNNPRTMTEDDARGIYTAAYRGIIDIKTSM